jgi:PIN domain nuclease of toxin-antitoxin system
MILLDTNALIWLDHGHPRTRPLSKIGRTLYISPATLLELQFLLEAGRVRLRSGSIPLLGDDDRWTLDDPPAASWFETALDLGWTRDPFDRLILAHARLRGWRLATGDAALLARLGVRERLEL